MEQNNKKIIFIAVILALVTSLLIFSYLRNVQTANTKIQYVTVYLAARDMGAKTIISQADINEAKVATDMLNKDAILDKNEIIGKTTKESIYQGEQILKSRLAGKINSSMTYQIPQGKRAITINVNEASAVGYFVKPGDMVDIIVTLQQETLDLGNKQVISPRISRTLLQNVLVLGVGQDKNTVEDLKAAESGQNKPAKNSTANGDATKTVTLAVSPDDAEKVTISEEAGILKLTLRPVGDNSTISSEGVTRDELVPAGTKITVAK